MSLLSKDLRYLQGEPPFNKLNTQVSLKVKFFPKLAPIWDAGHPFSVCGFEEVDALPWRNFDPTLFHGDIFPVAKRFSHIIG